MRCIVARHSARRYDRDADALLDANERELLWHNRELGCADARWLALLIANTDATRLRGEKGEQDAAEVLSSDRIRLYSALLFTQRKPLAAEFSAVAANSLVGNLRVGFGQCPSHSATTNHCVYSAAHLSMRSIQCI